MPAFTFATPRPADLVVEIDSGSIRVRALHEATDATTAAVEVTGDRADDVEVTQSGDRISIIGPRSSGFRRGHRELHVVVDVPAHSSLSVRTGSADLEVEGTTATTRVRSGSGDTVLDVTSGSASIATGSGDVRVHHARADLRVKSGSGQVHLGTTDHDVVVSTGSGDVEVDDNHGTTTVKTGSGGLAIGRSDADVSLATGSGDLRIGTTSRGRIAVHAASGDVAVGVAPGVPVWTDISTLSGRVRSSLPPVGEPADGQDHVELRATTVSGDVTLLER